MTLTASLILDVVIAALFLYFFGMGVRRGLILTLCSLLAVLIALAGGWALAKTCSPALAERIAPAITQQVQAKLEEKQTESTAESSNPLEQLGLPPQFVNQLQKLTASTASLSSESAAVLGASIAGVISKAILFLVGFAVVMIIWQLLCHGLNLVAKLPGLHFLNKALGGVLGLVEGFLLLMLARWVLCDLLGWIPQDVVAKSYLLHFLSSLPIYHLLGG